jgi:hypothetical protein
MPQRSTTATSSARARSTTRHSFTDVGRSSTATRTVLADEPGNDPQQGPAAFEAWVTNLQPTRTDRADTEATQAATNAGPGHALMLQARLRRRAKLARSLLITATIGLPLVLLLHAIQASAAGQRPIARSATPRPQLAGSPSRAVAPWLAGTARRDSADLAGGALDIQPAGTDSAVVYACWVDAQPDPSGTAAAAGSLHLAASDDGAYTWRTLSSPVARATACHLTPDGGDARRLALTTQVGTDTDSACPSAHTFLSADGGRHWSALILPGVLADGCTPTLAARASPGAAGFSLINGTLALWTNDTPTPSDKARTAQLWISLDFGGTWRAAGTGLSSGSIEGVVSARADGALLVLVRRLDAGTSAATPASYELWSCAAGCPQWQRLARVPSVPGSALAVFASSGAWLLPGANWGTLYVVDSTPTAAPGAPTSIWASTETQAWTWHPLPPLPWLGSEGVTAAAMSGRVLGVGPGGALVLELRNAALEMVPGSAAQEQAAVSVVCVWDPVRGQWLTPLLVEPATSSALAVVWDGQNAGRSPQLAIWLIMRSGEVWSMTAPAADVHEPEPHMRCQRCG